jgi:membrane fusion protein, multidrug efflux system
MRRRRWLWIAGLLASMSPGCGGDEKPVTVDVRPPVMVTDVALVTLEDRIEASGELKAPARAEIAAEVAGRITEIKVQEGTRVEAETVVLEIDPERRELELESVRAGLAEAQAQLREKERDFERIHKLHDQRVASDAQLDQARTGRALASSRVDAAEAALGRADRAARDSSVRAPFAGYVAQRLVSVGEFVQQGQPLFELVALDPIEVEFHLPEVDSGRVAIDNPVDVRVAPYPDERFRGRVSFVSPTIDERTRTLRVKAVLDNADGRLRPGLFARADLGVARRENVPMVPEEAVLQRADGAVIFVLRDGDRVDRRVVRTGAYRDGRVEIAEGVAAGERVVTRGHADLLDGAHVSVKQASAPPAPSTEVSSAPAPFEARP